MSEGSGPSPAELGITQKDVGLDKPVNNPIQATDARDQRLKIREFTKSTPEGRQARNDTARDMLGQRAEATQSRSQKRDYLTASQVSNDQNLTNAETARTEVENQLLALRGELTNRSTFWLARARAFVSRSFRKETQELQKQAPILEDRLEMTTAYSKTQQEIHRERLVELERQFQSLAEWYRTHPAGKETLQKFYEQQGKLLENQQQALEERKQKAELEAYRQKYGTVAEMARKFDSYVVHGISWVPGGVNNRVLAEDADWTDKLMVVMAEQPPLSGSFIEAGSGPQTGLWANIGVIMQSGIIAEAHAGDRDSEAVDLKTKQSRHSPRSIEQYQQGIEDAVTRNNVGFFGHSEVILEFGSKPGAFFINLDSLDEIGHDKTGIYRSLRDGSEIRYKNKTPRDTYYYGGVQYPEYSRGIEYQDIFDTAKFVGLPVVVIKDGTVYESSFNQTYGLAIGRKLLPKDITFLQSEIPSENLPEIQKRASSVLKTLAVA